MCGGAKFSILCQCRQCQRISGAGHAAQFAVDADRAQVHGDVRTYDLPADSGNTSTSGVCGDCGSPVLKRSSGYPQLLFLHAATLDAPAAFRPQMVVYSRFGQPWDTVAPELPRK